MGKQLATGTIIAGKYRLEREIGKGGLGSVYQATDLRLKRPVALKTLLYDRASFDQKPGAGADFELYLSRFEQEAAISSYFTANPNIITVHGLEQNSEDNFYLVMEYLEGGSLADLIKREGGLPVEKACQIALDICHALSEIHRHGADIVHRDLKPTNILLRANGQAVVADFGVAQVGHESRRVVGNGQLPRHPGSQPYMSPEQRASGDYLTPASDLYAVGLLLYEMITGRIFAKVKRQPLSLEAGEGAQVPGWLDALVAALLEEQVEKRPQLAEEVAVRLREGMAFLTNADLKPRVAQSDRTNRVVAVEPVRREEPAEEELTTPLAPPKAAPSPVEKRATYPEPLSAAQLFRLEKPEGTMNVQSTFYIERPTDQVALETIEQEGVTITIKGPRQMGKSSLLLRVRDAALKRGKQVALLDFQLFEKPALSNPEIFFRQFCEWLTDELELPGQVAEYWDSPLGNSQRTTRYLQRYLLKEVGGPLVVAMDEVDRTFDTPFRSDFFGMLRSWHNNRQTSPLWQQLDLVLVTSTEPYQLIEDLNQSPFNVGEVIELEDFSFEQVTELNHRHQSPFTSQEVQQLMILLGGHPYLVRRALYLVASHRLSSSTLFAEATADRGPFGDHLRNQLFRLHERPELVEGMRQVIQTRSCQDERIFFRLRGAGLVKREGRSIVPRCQLYAEYFKPGSLEIVSPLVSPAIQAAPSGKKGALAGLSEREQEVLKLLAAGHSNAQIADKLVLSAHTINSHLTSIYSKLEVTSRAEAMRYALQHKLV